MTCIFSGRIVSRQGEFPTLECLSTAYPLLPSSVSKRNGPRGQRSALFYPSRTFLPRTMTRIRRNFIIGSVKCLDSCTPQITPEIFPRHGASNYLCTNETPIPFPLFTFRLSKDPSLPLNSSYFIYFSSISKEWRYVHSSFWTHNHHVLTSFHSHI